MAFRWVNSENQWKFYNVDGHTLQDLINQKSVDGTGDVSDLNLPTTGLFNADEYFKTSTAVESGGDGSPLFTLAELKDAGFTVPEVKNHFELAELQSVGYSTTQIGNGGYSIKELVDANFTANQIIHETNFTADNLEEEGYALKEPTHTTESIGKYSTVTLSNNISKMISINNEIFILDNQNDKISKITNNNNDTITFNSDFITGLNKPKDIIKHQDNYYISNSGDNTIKIANTDGVLNDFALVGKENESGNVNGRNKLVTEDNTKDDNLSFQNSKINNPDEIFIDNSGNYSFYDKNNSMMKNINLSDNIQNYNENEVFYITNTDSHVISRLIDGYLSNWIGKKDESGDIDGDDSTTRLNNPVALKSITENNIENIYFLDKGNGKLKYFSNIENIQVTTLVSGLSNPEGFVKYGNDYYICDTGNNKIVKALGGGGVSDFININSPKDIIVVNNSTDNDHFFVTCGDHTIRKVLLNKTNYIISGIENTTGLLNGEDKRTESSGLAGTLTNSRYNSPTRIIEDNNNIIIVDNNNNALRKLELYGAETISEDGGTAFITTEDGKIIKYYLSTQSSVVYKEGLTSLNKIGRINNDLYITGTNSLKKINYATGEEILMDNNLNNPNSFLIEGNDFLIADTDNNKIVQLSRDPLIEVPGPIIYDEAMSQLGSDITGEETGERFGYSISYNSNGSILAVGAIRNAGNGSKSGSVKVYEWDGTIWSRKGFDIDGEASDDESGQDVKINQTGNVIAISAIGNDPDGQSKAGHVRVYEWKEYTQDDEDNDTYHYSSRLRDDEDDATQIKPIIITENFTSEPVVGNYYWIQKGKDINGVKKFDRSGYNISMNIDGSRIVVGEPYFDPIDDLGTKKNQGGRVRVYKYDVASEDWIVLGNDMSGVDTNDYFGYCVDIDDIGNYVAVGAYRGSSNDGYVKIFEYNTISEEWELYGSMINGESTSSQRFGSSISLDSYAKFVIIGAPLDDSNNGCAFVYKYDVASEDWIQHGAKIVGSGKQKLGHKVSLNWNASIIAVSGNEHSFDSFDDTGIVKLFKYSNLSNDWEQVFTNIVGSDSEELGTSVTLTREGNKLAIGGIGINSDTGNVKVFKFGEIDGVIYNEPTYSRTVIKDNISKPLDIVKDSSNNIIVSQQSHILSKIKTSDNSVEIIAGIENISGNVDGLNRIETVDHFNNEKLFIVNNVTSKFNKPTMMMSDGNEILLFR